MTDYLKSLKHHDNCGTGVIFSKNNVFDHEIVHRSLMSLHNMRHRGAVSYDGETPDGCGILFDLDHKFFQKIILLNPVFYMIDGFRYGFFGYADGSIVTGIILMIVLNTLLLLLCRHLFAIGYKIKA